MEAEGAASFQSAWRYTWMLVATMLVGALIGLGLPGLQTTLYTATW